MRLHICMCTCACGRGYICVYVYVCVDMCMCDFMCVYICMCVSVMCVFFLRTLIGFIRKLISGKTTFPPPLTSFNWNSFNSANIYITRQP